MQAGDGLGGVPGENQTKARLHRVRPTSNSPPPRTRLGSPSTASAQITQSRASAAARLSSGSCIGIASPEEHPVREQPLLRRAPRRIFCDLGPTESNLFHASGTAGTPRRLLCYLTGYSAATSHISQAQPPWCSLWHLSLLRPVQAFLAFFSGSCS